MTTFREYRDRINRIFARHTRKGFVDYYHCRELGSEMNETMEDAIRELASRGEYRELFDLANKAFLKWAKTPKDDSDGETQIFVGLVEEAWDSVYSSDDAGIPHAKMYGWFESHIDGSLVDYMEDVLCQYMVHRFEEPELLGRKYSFLAKKIGEGPKADGKRPYEYQIDLYREYLLYVMADMEKPIEEIRDYAEGFESYSKDRIMAKIERRYGNTDAAIRIYRKLAAEEDRRRRATDNWHLKLMDIYSEMGDEENYRKELVSAMRLSPGDGDLWKEYKRGFSAKEWPEARDAMFASLAPGDLRAFPWFAAEGRYDLIMEGTERTGDVSCLQAYEKELKARYPERCLKVLSDCTEAMAERSDKRWDYRQVARMLRWMQEYPGGKKKASALAEDFRARYGKRWAMMEEIAGF